MQCTRIKRVWILGFFVTFLFHVVCAKCITVVEWYLFYFIFLVQVVSVVEYIFFLFKSYVALRFLVSNGSVKRLLPLYREAHKGNIFLLYIANSYLMSNLCFIFPSFIYLFAVGFFWGFRIINLSCITEDGFFLLQSELHCM